jgi:leucyl aminopeptidase (aminopeptidase T)
MAADRVKAFREVASTGTHNPQHGDGPSVTEDDLRTAAVTAIDQCLALESDEECLIVTDDDRLEIGEALYSVAADRATASMIQYPPGETHGAEPPRPVAAALKDSDVFLAPTTKSLSHTRARSAACDAGARGATLPGITRAVFETGLDADYGAIQAACESVYEQVRGAEAIHVSTASGTDLTVSPGDRQWMQDTGVVQTAGGFSNLPAGEVFISPQSAEGTFVVDGTMMPHGRLDGRTIEFEVTDGQITAIGDDEIRQTVEEAAESVGDAAYNLAELGIGTNVAVSNLVGSVLLDEKAAGTVHLAIGDDASIGGDTEAPIHLDGIVTDVTVTADGDPVELPSV